MSKQDLVKNSIESWYSALHQQFVQCDWYQTFINKNSDEQSVKALILNICKSHLCSTQIVAFLYSISTPNTSGIVKDNMLEELGLHEGEQAHPLLLRKLTEAMDLPEQQWLEVEHHAQMVLKNKVMEPLLFGSLNELGLSIMLETFAFEWFLSREASQIGNMLKHYLQLSDDDLEWFFHHSEVDIAHAEQGLQTLADYIDYYEIDANTLQNITEITFRYNVFAKRYCDLQIEFNLDANCEGLI